MSEKYSTDDLVEWVETVPPKVEFQGEPHCIYLETPDLRQVKDSIITRLRAADKLCEAAKMTRIFLARDPDTRNFLDKAVADYEGK